MSHTPIKLYNTLGRKLQELKPNKPDEVTLYTCGPTVYNFAHIGNLRAFTFYDTLRRTLEANGLNVRHTMNITDVGHLVDDDDESSLSEDKLEKGARREGKTVWEVADAYTEAFKHDMAAMNVLPPNSYTSPKYHDTYARATEFIDEQIKMVQLLLDNGYAYQTKQAIYFDVAKLDSYGELSGQKLADKEVAVRDDIVTDPDKRHPFDFSVWFFTVGRYEGHSMHWPSPWGDGFPGWHLECSAIIHATLGDPIDIHTGGVDHIGTHHANEMAQTEAAFGHQLANMWVHNEFMLVDGAKMAKSKGNSYTLKDITDRGYHPLALRLMYLQAHYRSELNFTWESLDAATNRLINLLAMTARRFQLGSKEGGVRSQDLEPFRARLLDALSNDLGTPEALKLLGELESEISSRGIDDNHQTNSDFISLIKEFDNLLGIGLLGQPDITPEQKALIADREAARQAKDWARSDELRGTLAEQNLAVDDTPAGPRWRRTTLSI